MNKKAIDTKVTNEKTAKLRDAQAQSGTRYYCKKCGTVTYSESWCPSCRNCGASLPN